MAFREKIFDNILVKSSLLAKKFNNPIFAISQDYYDYINNEIDNGVNYVHTKVSKSVNSQVNKIIDQLIEEMDNELGEAVEHFVISRWLLGLGEANLAATYKLLADEVISDYRFGNKTSPYAKRPYRGI